MHKAVRYVMRRNREPREVGRGGDTLSFRAEAGKERTFARGLGSECADTQERQLPTEYTTKLLYTLAPFLGPSALRVIALGHLPCNLRYDLLLICARSVRSTATRSATEKGSNFNVSLRLREGECCGAISI